MESLLEKGRLLKHLEELRFLEYQDTNPNPNTSKPVTVTLQANVILILTLVQL